MCLKYILKQAKLKYFHKVTELFHEFIAESSSKLKILVRKRNQNHS